MKLATALSERSDLQKRIASLSNRLYNNARVQEGETPTEDPHALLDELDACSARLEELVTKINLTNSQTVIDGETLTSKLSRRDTLKGKLNIIRSFLSEASNLAGRASRSEIKIKSSVRVTDIQKDVDKMSKELRILEECIQESNWTTELIE